MLPFPPPPPHSQPNPSLALGTCVRAREGAEEPGVLAVAVMHLHDVVEGCVEEGKLAEHHCGGDIA